jgi:hypothetical protein
MSIGKLFLHSTEAVPQSIGADTLYVAGRLGPVSPAALAYKGLFSPICTSIGLIRQDFRPISRFSAELKAATTADVCSACAATSGWPGRLRQGGR